MPTVQLARILGQLCCVQRQSLTTHGHADADGTYAAARAAPPRAGRARARRAGLAGRRECADCQHVTVTVT